MSGLALNDRGEIVFTSENLKGIDVPVPLHEFTMRQQRNMLLRAWLNYHVDVRSFDGDLDRREALINSAINSVKTL